MIWSFVIACCVRRVILLYESTIQINAHLAILISQVQFYVATKFHVHNLFILVQYSPQMVSVPVYSWFPPVSPILSSVRPL